MTCGMCKWFSRDKNRPEGGLCTVKPPMAVPAPTAGVAGPGSITVIGIRPPVEKTDNACELFKARVEAN